MHNDRQSYDGRRAKFKKSTVQKILGGTVVAFAVIAVVTVSLVLGLKGLSVEEEAPAVVDSLPHFRSSSGAMDYCLSEPCVHTASRMLTRMDLSVDPCEDFSRTACRRLPSHTSRVDATFQVKQLTIRKLHDIISREISENDNRKEKTLKELYQACMNNKTIEMMGLAPMKDILQRLGGWPVLEGTAWNSSNFQWTRLVYQLRKFGLESNGIIKVYVDPSRTITQVRMITIDVPDLSLSRQSFLRGSSDVKVQAYMNYQTDIAMQLGASREYAVQEMEHVLKFEILLANISYGRTKNYQRQDNILSVTNLKRKYHSVPWTEYIHHIFADKVKYGGNEYVNVKNPTFIQNLGILLAYTNKRTLANYLIWRAVDYLTPMSTSDLTAIHFKYSQITLGTKVKPPRWEKCTHDMISHFPTVASAIFAAHYFDIEIMKEVSRVVNVTLEGLQKNLGHADWLDDKTREEISQDLQATTFHIPHSANPNIFEAFDTMIVDRSLYMNAMLSATKFRMKQMASCLHEEHNPDACPSPNTHITAITYSHADKTLRIPLELLQLVIYNYEQQSYLNSATLGSYVGYIIARECFDKIDQFDRYRQLVLWWVTKQEILRNLNCLKVPKRHMSEIQWKNVVYWIGVNATYTGYAPYWGSRLMNSRALPGFNLMGKREMFWIAAAQMLCFQEPTGESSGEDLEGELFRDLRVDTVFARVKHLLSDFRCDEEKLHSHCDIGLW